jgi:hypothetical protein
VRRILTVTKWLVPCGLAAGSAMAGGIDWATPATDVSSSLQGAAYEMIPFVGAGGALAAGFYLQNLMPAVIGMVGALFLAANADQLQTVVGGGGGGGLITDTVYVQSVED